MDEQELKPNHASRRYVARICDLLLFALITVAAGIDGNFANESITGLYLIALYYLVYEPLLLLVYGTTPFKWLLGLSIVSANHDPLTNKRKALRSLYVWAYGYGLGIPLVTFACMAYNLYKAIKGRPFTWDQRVATKVEAKPLAMFSLYCRYSFTIAFMISIATLAVVGERLERSEGHSKGLAAVNLIWENSVTENQVAVPNAWQVIDLVNDGAAANVIGKFERQNPFASAALMYNHLPSITNIRTYTRELYATKKQAMDFATLGPISAFSSPILVKGTESYTFTATWTGEDQSELIATFIVWQATDSPSGFWHIAIIANRGYSSEFEDAFGTMYESTITTDSPFMSISL